MPRMNVANVLSILNHRLTLYIHFNAIRDTVETDAEIKFGHELSDIIIEGCERGDTISETLVLTDFLIVDTEYVAIDSLPSSRKSSVASTSSLDIDYTPPTHKSPGRSAGARKADDDKNKVLKFAWKQDGGRKKITSIQNRFSWVSDWKEIDRWKQQLANHGGDREQILKKIDQGTFADFQVTREKGIDIHDEDLQIWASNHAAAYDFEHSFQASSNWAQKFKKRHGITSRRITAFVTKVSFQDEDKLRDEGVKWAENMRNLINTRNISPAFVFNADQSGFNYEMTRKRSLAFVGEERVDKAVDSKNATNIHSQFYH